jgi:hypothetical protein
VQILPVIVEHFQCLRMSCNDRNLEVKQVIDTTLHLMCGNDQLHVSEKWMEQYKTCIAYEGIILKKKQCRNVRNPQIASNTSSLIALQVPLICIKI